MAAKRRREVSHLIVENNEEKKELTLQQRLCKYCKIFTITSVILIIIVFILAFVVLPLIFMNTVKWQEWLIFHNHNVTPQNPEFRYPEKYNMEAVENLYVTVDLSSHLSLGVWYILPEQLISNGVTPEKDLNYTKVLFDENFPVVLYLHETNGNRITPLNMYKVLRRFFHVITIDYRSYGDSNEGNLSEVDIVKDVVFMYKWLKRRTNGEVFIWGHALGAAISTRAIAELQKEKIVPTGLFLEAGFTELKELLLHNDIIKFFSWLPWFNATVVDALEYNGFRFKTQEDVVEVNCPIMIVHAEDDHVVPYTMGEELFKTAQEKRNVTVQGSVSFYLFPGNLVYDHWRIYQAPELPNYIENHIDVCREFHRVSEETT
ncbi:hypothetical protein ILUMI_10170 [Ignelater luminosus]|uniref:Uncharacterized protein n=1 Tax=Ignelater luminosus TaxID=2038154 RepID=A0A8K0CYD7_IGNLU|nr:hypothetical protein ILUMI_10170 [Ignelater luminosus]